MGKRLLYVGCMLFAVVGFGQTNFTSGWLPKVNMSKSLSDRMKWVQSIEAREVVYKEETQFTHKLVDVSTIFSYKTAIHQSFNFGYILRFEGDAIVHRLVQHFNWIQHLDALKLGHRFGMEQFYQYAEKPQYRTRYRITLEKPLSGDKVDVKEWYIKVANEYLYQFNREELEARLSPYLGYRLGKRNKLEFGLDYRLGRLLDTTQKNALWFRTTWYISL